MLGTLAALGAGLAGAAVWRRYRPTEAAEQAPAVDLPAEAVEDAVAYRPPPVGSPEWGTVVPVAAQQLLLRAEEITAVPGLAVFLAIVGQGEGNWNYLRGRQLWDARNTREGEVEASRRAYDSGLERGLPKPGQGTAVRDFGSGGAFGALAPYVAWAGFTDKSMPLLNEPPEVIFQPATGVAHAAWYATRLLRAPYDPKTWAQVRLGWASPAALRGAPGGALAAQVLGRMMSATEQAQLGAAAERLPAQPVRLAGGERQFARILDRMTA